MNPELEILLIAILVSLACALPGCFLVLRKMSLMSDAISHALLPGIVIGFLLTGSLASPLLIVGAVIMGLVTVSLTELLSRTNLVKEDAAIGMVFPFLFSIGVILVTRLAGNVHLDTDAVLLGELAFAPFNRLELAGVDMGPRNLYVMGGILLFNLAFLLLFYKELALSTFDKGLAASMGFKPGLLHYALMLCVSITAVGAFDSVGSILVVALMIAPPASAFMLTRRLPRMLMLSALLATLAAGLGYWVSYWLDTSIAGCIAVANGAVFFLTFLFAPRRGVLAAMGMRRRQKWDFALAMLAVHISHHEDSEEGPRECRIDHLQEHINWAESFADRVIALARQRDLILVQDRLLSLTEEGRAFAKDAAEQL